MNESEDSSSMNPFQDQSPGFSRYNHAFNYDPSFDIEGIHMDDLNLPTNYLPYEEGDITEIIENDEVKRKIEEGINIEEYLNEVEKDLVNVERETVIEYLSHSDHFAKLYLEMTQCEKIIEQMETVLSGFQSSLGTVASQILSLQKQAEESEILQKTMTEKQAYISKFVDVISLPPNLVRELTEISITNSYITYLQEFSSKLKNIETYRKDNTKAVEQVLPEFEKLSGVVCLKIQEWILQKFTMAFKDIETLLSIHHQLIHFRYLYEFLLDDHPELSQNISSQYVTQASSLYYRKFKDMCKQTAKMHYSLATKDDLIVSPSSIVSTFFTKSSTSTQKSNIFSLGSRMDILSTLDQTSFFPRKIDNKLPFEYLFKCINYHLKEYYIEEIYFSQSFLHSTIAAEKVLIKSSNTALKLFETVIENSFDMVGILLKVIILSTYYQELLDKYENVRKIFDQYYHKLFEFLVRRFELVFNINLESIQKAKTQTPTDVHPLLAVRRYGEFLRAGLTLTTKYPDETRILKIPSKLKLMRNEIEGYITKHGNGFTDKEKMSMFFINNYSILKDAVLDFVDTELMANFTTKLHGFISQLANTLLISEFGYIVKFVQENSAMDTNGSIISFNDPTADPRFVEDLLKKFHDSWKEKLGNMNTLILGNLGTNLRNGLEVLDLASRDMILYYKHFVEIIKLHYKTLQNSKLIVTETEITYEMKSYLGILGKEKK